MTKPYRQPIQKIFDQLRQAYLNKQISLFGYYPRRNNGRRSPDCFIIDLLPTTTMHTANNIRKYLELQGSFECTIEPEMKMSSGESYYRLRAWFRN